MYFDNVDFRILTESLSYTMKNLIDYFTTDKTDLGRNLKDKMKRVEDEFDKYYVYDERIERKILREIKSIAFVGELDPIDIPKVDKFFHLRMNLKVYEPNDSINKEDFDTFYAMIYKALYGVYDESYFSKYTLVRMVGGHYIVFITFDEKSVEGTYLVASENQFDLEATVRLLPLNIDSELYKK